VAPEDLAALPPPQHIPPAWWMGSYTALVQGGGDGSPRAEAPDPDPGGEAAIDAIADHDALALSEGTPVAPEEPEAEDEAAAARASIADAARVPAVAAVACVPVVAAGPAVPAVPADDILRFPRGAQAGRCLHAAFEHADFGDPATWPAAVARALHAFPPAPATRPAETALHQAMLLHALRDTLHTPLVPGLDPPLVLADVGAAQRRAELEFTLPVPRLGLPALAALLRRHDLPVPPLAAHELRGFLRGFIDLVFTHAGRWWVLDWKSNHLGHTAADHGAAPMAAAMAAHGYHLQALLYTVALHRHLRLRLPGYRPEAHLGGALVLFVRGVRPGWTDAAGVPAGVVHWPVPPALVLETSALLGDEVDGTAGEEPPR
jgi:exodeoxyribonuclease V beta subunit